MATEPVSDATREQDYYQLDRRLTILETRFDTILPTLATKADLAELKAELKAEFKGELGGLSRWVGALFVTTVLGFASIFATLFALLKH